MARWEALVVYPAPDGVAASPEQLSDGVQANEDGAGWCGVCWCVHVALVWWGGFTDMRGCDRLERGNSHPSSRLTIRANRRKCRCGVGSTGVQCRRRRAATRRAIHGHELQWRGTGPAEALLPDFCCVGHLDNKSPHSAWAGRGLGAFLHCWVRAYPQSRLACLWASESRSRGMVWKS